MRALCLALGLLALPAFAQETDTPLAQQWDGFLRGKRLTQMSSYSSGTAGGYNRRADLFLCRDGRFIHRHESSTSLYVDGATGSSVNEGEDRGVWQIVTQDDDAAIYIKTDDGAQEGYLPLAQNDHGQTFLNRTRTFVTDENDACP
jgi:hypothetical protein